MNASGSNPIVYGPASGTRTINGNVTISGNASSTITLKNLVIKGNLIVNTPSATINNYATVEGTTTIQDVANGTWNEFASNNSLVVNDPNGIVLNVKQQAVVKSIIINQPTTLNLEPNSILNGLQVTTADTIVTNNGVLDQLNTNHPIRIDGDAPKTIIGNGAISYIEDAPEVEIKDYVTYEIDKGIKFRGIQARIMLNPDQLAKAEAGDRVVVTLLAGEQQITSTNIENKQLNEMFINEFNNEEYYASTLFLPNSESFMTSSWATDAWKTPVKPSGLKVEIKRGEKVIYSVTSSNPLNESFTDGISTKALSWEEVLEFNQQ